MLGKEFMDLKQLKNVYKKEKHMEYIFFWGHSEKAGTITKACLSQWYPCKFKSNGIIYYTAEQYMMAQKALLFNDQQVFNEIMQAPDPRQYQKLGRRTRYFKEEVWNKHKYKIVVDGNIAKFSQNPELGGFLKKTRDKILVEASPYDRIWGIGMAQDNPDINNPFNWNGSNLLGFALMDVRKILWS